MTFDTALLWINRIFNDSIDPVQCKGSISSNTNSFETALDYLDQNIATKYTLLQKF